MMMMTSPAPVRRVLAPDGSVLTLADLPRLTPNAGSRLARPSWWPRCGVACSR